VDVTPPPDQGESLLVWAFVNLVVNVVGLILAIVVVVCMLLRRKRKEQKCKQQRCVKDQTMEMYDEVETQQKQRRTLWLFVAVVMGIAGIIVFLLTEDMRNPMVMVDKWTIVNVILFIVEIIAVALIFKRKKTTTSTTAVVNEQKKPNTLN
jgi:Mg2+/citrate symporter